MYHMLLVFTLHTVMPDDHTRKGIYYLLLMVNRTNLHVPLASTVNPDGLIMKCIALHVSQLTCITSTLIDK
jgi:hypothetical protein